MNHPPLGLGGTTNSPSSKEILVLAFRAHEVVVNLWLGTRLNTSHVISHWVHACLGWVDFDYSSKFVFATLELFLPVDAERLTELEDQGFRVNPSVQHRHLRVDRHIATLLVVVLHWKIKVLLHFKFILRLIIY